MVEIRLFIQIRLRLIHHVFKGYVLQRDGNGGVERIGCGGMLGGVLEAVRVTGLGQDLHVLLHQEHELQMRCHLDVFPANQKRKASLLSYPHVVLCAR